MQTEPISKITNEKKDKALLNESIVVQKFAASRDFFFCRKLWNDRMDQCNVGTASRFALLGLFCPKFAGFQGSLFQKLFKGYIFCLLGNSFGLIDFWVICPWNKFGEKEQCE